MSSPASSCLACEFYKNVLQAAANGLTHQELCGAVHALLMQSINCSFPIGGPGAVGGLSIPEKALTRQSLDDTADDAAVSFPDVQCNPDIPLHMHDKECYTCRSLPWCFRLLQYSTQYKYSASSWVSVIHCLLTHLCMVVQRVVIVNTLFKASGCPYEATRYSIIMLYSS